MRAARIAALVVMFAAGGMHAQGQPAPAVSEAAKEMVGGWELSNAEHDRRCKVTFSTDAAPGGFKLALDQGCAAVFPMFKDLATWSIVRNGALRLSDGKGNAALEMSEVESGIFEGERRGEGLYFMQPQAAVTIPERTPEQMFGDWNFLREIDRQAALFADLVGRRGARARLQARRQAGLRRRHRGFRTVDLAARGRPAGADRSRRLLAVRGERHQYLGAHPTQHQSAVDAQAVTGERSGE